MRFVHRIFLAAVFLAWFGAGTALSEELEDRIALVSELTNLAIIPVVVDPLIEMITSQMKGIVVDRNPDGPEDLADIYSEEMIKAKERLIEPVFKSVVAMMAASNFTSKQLEEQIAFFRTKAGKKARFIPQGDIKVFLDSGQTEIHPALPKLTEKEFLETTAFYRTKTGRRWLVFFPEMLNLVNFLAAGEWSDYVFGHALEGTRQRLADMGYGFKFDTK